MRNDSYITVIGGSNTDISGFPQADYSPQDSNPGRITLSAGGVGRNIAENIARLGCTVNLLSAVGNDGFGTFLLEECRKAGVETEEILISESMPSSAYLCIMDQYNDLQAAVNDMEIIRLLTPELISRKSGLLSNAAAVVIDNNISPETIEAVKKAGCRRIIFDAVSGKKLKQSMNSIRNIDCVKLNSIEAEILSGISFEVPEAEIVSAAAEASALISARGISHVFITLGGSGAHYRNGDEHWHSPPLNRTPVNTTGAGDAFIAGVTAGFCRNIEGRALLAYASTCAGIAAASKKTVSEKISHQLITTFLNGEKHEF